MTVPSQLGRRIGPSVWNAAEIREQARRLWQSKRIAMIAVDEIANAFERQTVINVARAQLDADPKGGER